MFCEHVCTQTHTEELRLPTTENNELDVLVIEKRQSEEFLLFEVEMGGHQVEELVRQELRLWRKVQTVSLCYRCYHLSSYQERVKLKGHRESRRPFDLGHLFHFNITTKLMSGLPVLWAELYKEGKPCRRYPNNNPFVSTMKTCKICLLFGPGREVCL